MSKAAINDNVVSMERYYRVRRASPNSKYLCKIVNIHIDSYFQKSLVFNPLQWDLCEFFYNEHLLCVPIIWHIDNHS